LAKIKIQLVFEPLVLVSTVCLIRGSHDLTISCLVNLPNMVVD